VAIRLHACGLERNLWIGFRRRHPNVFRYHGWGTITGRFLDLTREIPQYCLDMRSVDTCRRLGRAL